MKSKAFAAGMVAVVVHSPKFAIRDIVGEIQFVPGTIQKASLALTIATGSLEIMDEVSSADRREIDRMMFDKVLERNIYPRIEYKSSRASAAKTAVERQDLGYANRNAKRAGTREIHDR